jgi:hypothetical protein
MGRPSASRKQAANHEPLSGLGRRQRDKKRSQRPFARRTTGELSADPSFLAAKRERPLTPRGESVARIGHAEAIRIRFFRRSKALSAIEAQAFYPGLMT